jgi:hypothetical protein
LKSANDFLQIPTWRVDNPGKADFVLPLLITRGSASNLGFRAAGKTLPTNQFVDPAPRALCVGAIHDCKVIPFKLSFSIRSWTCP